MTTEGMAEYICECDVKGIGKKLSQDIVDQFGRKTFRYLGAGEAIHYAEG